MQIFRRREVILVLLYNLLITTTISPFIFVLATNSNIPRYVVVIVSCIAVSAFPIAGCLADLRFGRYKLIKISMWLTWICVVIQSVMSIALQATDELDGSPLFKVIKLLY